MHPYVDPMRGQTQRDSDEQLDRAWAAFHATSPEFGEGSQDGMSNHGPMAAESLAVLGHPEAIEGFVEAYRPRLRPMSLGRVLPPSARHAALGDPSQMADWIATYAQRIDDEGPAAVLATDVPLLADGAMAGALHALIRTGHAARALRQRDTPTRRLELAHALGYWAARHQPMPGNVGSRVHAGRDVIAALTVTPRTKSTGGGIIFRRVEAVRQTDGFTDAVATVDLDALPFDEAVTAMVDAAAHLYLSTRKSRFIYLHGITGSSALRLIGPWLDDRGRRSLLRGAFHAVAALHSVYAGDDGVVEAPLPTLTVDPAQAARLAADSNDDHTIKLVEALLREHALAPRPVLAHVLAHRLGRA